MTTSSASLELNICIGESEPTLDVSVIVNTDIPREIFVYRQSTDQDSLGCYLNNFCAVASCAQLTDLPAGAPAVGQAFFRLGEVNMTFSDFGILAEFLDTLCADVDMLIECWNKKIMFTENKFIITFPRC